MSPKIKSSYNTELFKQNLWSQITLTYSGDLWSYSRYEKLLFYLLLTLLLSLTIFYFNFYNTETLTFKSRLRNLSSYNSYLIKELERVSPSRNNTASQ